MEFTPIRFRQKRGEPIQNWWWAVILVVLIVLGSIARTAQDLQVMNAIAASPRQWNNMVYLQLILFTAGHASVVGKAPKFSDFIGGMISLCACPACTVAMVVDENTLTSLFCPIPVSPPFCIAATCIFAPAFTIFFAIFWSIFRIAFSPFTQVISSSFARIWTVVILFLVFSCALFTSRCMAVRAFPLAMKLSYGFPFFATCALFSLIVHLDYSNRKCPNRMAGCYLGNQRFYDQGIMNKKLPALSVA